MAESGQSVFLNPTNIDHMLEQPRTDFAWIGFDPIDNCNLHCVYCHNPRTRERIDLEKLQKFLVNNVDSVVHFQVGCAMEPCLHSRLIDVLSMIAQSAAKPTRIFKLHTNGTLLHRHDHARMCELGLTHLSVSIDSADEVTFGELRGGADLDGVFANIEEFCRTAPQVVVQFIATVNRANVDEMDRLIDRGVEAGATRFHFREMFHRPGGQVLDDAKVAPLVLAPGRFVEMQQQIEAKYADAVGLFFGSANFLVEKSRDARRSSSDEPVTLRPSGR